MAIEFINTKKLAARIAELRDELAQLLHLESLAGKKPKRSASVGGDGEKAKAAKSSRRGKRGKLGETILKFLSTKGKEGAHVKEIAAAAKSKPANVTAWTYTTGKGKVRRVKPATFALVK